MGKGRIKSITYVCEACGQSFHPRNRKTRFCSYACRACVIRGANHPSWKGERCDHGDGYWTIYVDGKHVLEHRHIMEQHLGRPLAAGETVHHRDGDPGNNTLSNLVLLGSQGEHLRSHRKTYRSDTHKQCTKCGTIKPRAEFPKAGPKQSRYDPHDGRCKECMRAYSREYDRLHPGSRGQKKLSRKSHV